MTTPTSSPSTPFDVLGAVRDRYTDGAQDRVPELCCPVDYDASLLEVLPAEIIERDYGCGDPSRHVRPGDTVLDLGSGAGKICYMASQIAGPEGRVIGVDATAEMLALARRHRAGIAEKIGWDNVEFLHGHIQDLRLDRDQLAAWLAQHPAADLEGLEALRVEEARLRAEEPLVADDSVDLVLSNCVLNLVAPEDKQQLFAEIHRVLRRGGRCAISDIVSDEDVPAELVADPELWSGCISGALREDRFLQAFVDAGLYGASVVEYQTEPWAVVQGIQFRSMTVVAHKGLEGACWDHREAVVYRGPFHSVKDDDGHEYVRGERTAVCRKTYEILGRAPYDPHFQPIPPARAVSDDEARPFDCATDRLRDPRDTKRDAAPGDSAPGGCC